MKVTGHATVKGRGTVTLIDALPAEVQVNTYVTASNPDRVWMVLAIETHAIPRFHAMPRSHTNGQPAGLFLHGRMDPAVGDVLVVLDDKEDE